MARLSHYNFAELPDLLGFWHAHRIEYDPPVFVVVLCGDATKAEASVFVDIVRNHVAIDDMSGRYASVSVLARRASPNEVSESTRSPRRALDRYGYVHGVSPWDLGAQGVYSLAQAIGIPLTEMPAVIVVADPWVQGTGVVYSLRYAGEADDSEEQTTQFMMALLTACRNISDLPAGARIKAVRREMRKSQINLREVLNSVVETGVIAEIVQGIVGGLKG